MLTPMMRLLFEAKSARAKSTRGLSFTPLGRATYARAAEWGVIALTSARRQAFRSPNIGQRVISTWPFL